MSSTRIVALWVVLVGFSGLIAVSIFRAELLRQPIWTPSGLTKLLVVAAVYAVWACALRLFHAGVFVAATCTAAFVYSCLIAGPLAVFGACLVLFTCWVIGRSIVDHDALAIVLGLAIVTFAVGLAAHVSVNYPLVYAGVFAAVLAARWQVVRTCAATLVRMPRISGDLRGWPRLAAEMAGFILVCHLLVALKPEVSADGLGMHLVIPFRVAQYHLWDFNFRAVNWAVMPMGGDWAFTAAFLLGGELAARLLNFGVLAVLAALVYALARMHAGRGISLLATAMFLSTPVVQLVTGSLFVENVWAAFVVGGVVALAVSQGNGRLVAVSGALFGSALASKFGAIACVVPALPFVFRRRGAVSFSALLLLFAAPPYVSAWVKTGNPMFPFFNSVFKSPYFESAHSLVDTRFRAPLRPDTLWDVTFHTSHFLESQDGAFGFQYLLLVPLIAVAFSRQWPLAARVAAAVGGCSFLLTFAAQPYVRYVYPALALTSGLAAFALERFRHEARMLFGAAAVVCGALFGLNVYFLPAASWYHRGFFPTPFDAAATDQYLTENAAARSFVEELNEKAPGQPVAMFATNQYAGLRATAYTDTWHHKSFADRMMAARNPIECLQIFNALGIHWFIAPDRNSGLAVRNPATQRFLELFTRTERRRGRFYLARLIPAYEGPAGLARAEVLAFRPPTALPGTYDDTAENIAYNGRWERAKSFPKAHDATVTFSNIPGDTATMYFEGRSVTYVFTKAFNRGKASLSLDGDSCRTVDLYSAQQVVWQASVTCRAPEKGVHELVIRVLGGTSTTGAFVDVDALIVR